MRGRWDYAYEPAYSSYATNTGRYLGHGITDRREKEIGWRQLYDCSFLSDTHCCRRLQ